MKPGAQLVPAMLSQAVKKADFSAGALHMEASGTVAVQAGKKSQPAGALLFEVRDTKQRFILGSPPSETKENDKRDAELLPQLRAKFAAGRRHFTISGLVSSDKEAALRLTVEHFQEMADEKP